MKEVKQRATWVKHLEKIGALKNPQRHLHKKNNSIAYLGHVDLKKEVSAATDAIETTGFGDSELPKLPLNIKK